MRTTLATFTGLLLTAAVAAQMQQAGPATYDWNAELVSLDAGAKAIVLKSRIVGEAVADGLGQFKAGERVNLIWSGHETTADAVRRVMKYDRARISQEAFLLPAELVTTEVQRDYITIKLQMPERGIAALTSLKAGEWVTVTSRHRPSSDGEAVVGVKPYSASRPTTTG